MRGNDENDSIDALDGDTADFIYCGGGIEDIARFDTNDITNESDFVSNSCEHHNP
jgi:hypothetical protein